MPPSLSRVSLGLPGLRGQVTFSLPVSPDLQHLPAPHPSSQGASSLLGSTQLILARGLGAISPQHSLPDLPWLLLKLAPHGRPPHSGRPPSGPSDPPWALTSHHGSHRALWAHLRSPLLCIHLRAQFPALSSPWRSAREARSLAHRAASRSQGCASLAVRCSMQHACVWWASQLLCSLCSSRLPGCGGAERPRASCSEQRRSSVLTSFDFVICPSRPSPEMQETPSHSLCCHTQRPAPSA